MDKKTAGSWLVHHTHKLSHVGDTGEFGNIRMAGKCGILLSALSSSSESTLNDQQVATLAQAAKIDATFELPALLTTLSANHFIDKGQQGISVLGLTTSAILQNTTNIFQSLNPNSKEIATLSLAESCSTAPRKEDELHELLQDTCKLSSQSVSDLLAASEEIGFTDVQQIDDHTRLYFNGNLFRDDEIRKVGAVLDSLKPAEVRKVEEVDALLKSRGCVTADELKAMLGQDLFSKLQSIGMYDVSVVSNSKESTAFVTRPSAFSKYGVSHVSDAFDNAKALIAAISYGISRSSYSRGRITMVTALLTKLINGYWVGPATAIGEDYKILELRNVLQVKVDRHGYSMRLLKKDVGELAFQVLTEGDASEQSLPEFPGASVTQFQAPEERRSRERRRTREHSTKQLANMLQSLRSGRG